MVDYVMVPREALQRARDLAMRQTAEARIPECGDFGAIAQDLDAMIAAAPASPIPTSVNGAGEREALPFRLVRGGANSHCFDDRLVAGDETIGFLDEAWSDRVIAVLSPALDNTAVEGQGDGAGWIVGNNVGQWRTFDSFGWAWTDRRDLAIRYARRADAELVHGEDEDSWRVERYSAALTAETEKAR